MTSLKNLFKSQEKATQMEHVRLDKQTHSLMRRVTVYSVCSSSARH